MFVITIRFLNGKYHATPWGKHVNEGVPEWPPSTWRLIRAMIASWKRSLPDLPNDTVWPILQKMAAEIPSYRLPVAHLAHSRHYMPAPLTGTLVMDTFVIIGDKPVAFIWKNLTLNETEFEIIENILKNIHYLGRAESWCTAEVSTVTYEPNCTPYSEQDIGNTDLVYVLTPKSSVKFTDGMGKNADADLESITVTTSQLHDKKYMNPPGGKWVPYQLPQNSFERMLPVSDTSIGQINLVRYAIVSKIRPRIKDILRVGDIAKATCMSRYGKEYGGDVSPTFSGKGKEGVPLKGHQHAFYLPTYECQNSEIDHLTIISAKGFSKQEQTVLFDLPPLRSYNMTVNLLFQGCGTLDDFSHIPILQESRRWVSCTPLVLSRYIKRRGKKPNVRVIDGLHEQIRNEIKNRYGDSYKVKTIKKRHKLNIYNTTVKPFEFYRWRSHGRMGADTAYDICLEFEEPVRGPINLGYSSHYGLGMFVPDGGVGCK